MLATETDLGGKSDVSSQDYASQRGLKKILSQRFRQLKYLHQVDQRRYHKLISDLGLRNQVES